MTDAEREELAAMWDGWCFATPQYGSAFCTEPKGHEGGHCCDFTKAERYTELRWAANVEQRRQSGWDGLRI